MSDGGDEDDIEAMLRILREYGITHPDDLGSLRPHEAGKVMNKMAKYVGEELWKQVLHDKPESAPLVAKFRKVN